MPFKFNPFTGTLDAVNAPADQYLDGEVEFHGDLPVGLGIPAINSAFLVRKGSGLYFLTRKPAGIWVRELNNGNLDDWKYAGNFSDLYRDSNFRIISDTDTSREIAFSAASISSGQTRTITVPDKNVTLDDAADARTPTAHKTTHAIGGTDALTPADIGAAAASHTHDAGTDITTGTLADARLSTNVPLKDASNTFTQNQTLDGTNNVAPNQTAASGSSLMTRALVDARTTTNLWIPASAWIPRTTAGCGVDSREIGSTNRQNFDELLFDAATDEFAQALVIMPSNYNNSTITARFYWTAASGSGDVIWGIQGRAYADDDALDSAHGTAQTATDTLLAADDMHASAATSAVTIGGTPAANAPIQFQIYRDADAGGDTLAVDARLLGVEIIFN